MTIFIYKWGRIKQFFPDDDYVAIIVVIGESYFHGEVNWGL
jgi:hypothetical protein